MSDESWLIEDEVTKRFLRCWVIAPIFFMVPYVVVSPKYETVEWGNKVQVHFLNTKNSNMSRVLHYLECVRSQRQVQ